MSALAGIRVVELSLYGLGPFGGALLANLGADIIKVEPPQGEAARHSRVLVGSVDCRLPDGRNALYETFNRNKRGIVLDLKADDGCESLRRLVRHADVFLHNYRPGVLERLGFGYEAVAQENPGVVYAAASGYGPLGDDATRPGLDYVGQARSGFMMSTGGPGAPPQYSTGAIADMSGGVILAYAVLAALVERSRSGLGQRVDISHLGATMAMQGWSVGVASLLNLPAWPRMDPSTAGNALWNHYECQDREWIAFSMQEDRKAWEPFARAVELPGLLTDARFATSELRLQNSDALGSAISAQLRTHPRAHWVDRLAGHSDLLWDRVQSVTDLRNDPQVLANEYLVPYHDRVLGPTMIMGSPAAFSRTKAQPGGDAPQLGEHTAEVLGQLTASGGTRWPQRSSP